MKQAAIPPSSANAMLHAARETNVDTETSEYIPHRYPLSLFDMDEELETHKDLRVLSKPLSMAQNTVRDPQTQVLIGIIQSPNIVTLHNAIPAKAKYFVSASYAR